MNLSLKSSAKIVFIDLNGTLEIEGAVNGELAAFIRDNQSKAKFYLWTGDPQSGHEFLAKNNLTDCFSSILPKMRGSGIIPDIAIDDDEMLLKASKAKIQILISDFSNRKDSLL